MHYYPLVVEWIVSLYCVIINWVSIELKEDAFVLGACSAAAMMKRKVDAAPVLAAKRHRDDSSSDEESRLSRQGRLYSSVWPSPRHWLSRLHQFSFPDSSQNESLSDQEEPRAGFSMPSISVHAKDADSPPEGSTFSMYNSVSQKLMVTLRTLYTTWDYQESGKCHDAAFSLLWGRYFF